MAENSKGPNTIGSTQLISLQHVLHGPELTPSAVHDNEVRIRRLPEMDNERERKKDTQYTTLVNYDR